MFACVQLCTQRTKSAHLCKASQLKRRTSWDEYAPSSTRDKRIVWGTNFVIRNHINRKHPLHVAEVPLQLLNIRGIYCR